MNPIFLAIDTPDAVIAREAISQVREFIGGVKIGLTFFYANGPEGTARLLDDLRFDQWFFDGKIYDIPVQAAGAIRSIMPLKPTYISLHIGEMTIGASEADRWSEQLMMRAVVGAAGEESVKLGVPRPKLLGVTKLTNMPATLAEIAARAYCGINCGLDGIISSPVELRTLRSELGLKPILLTPSIRDPKYPVANDDQTRTATPREAIDHGADIIVIGRPIMEAPNRAEAAARIMESLK